MISALRSIARKVTPLALDLYDRIDTGSLLGLIARIVSNEAKEKEGSLEWATVFPELRRWMDERSVQKAFTGVIKWVGFPHEITLEYDSRDAERESTLVVPTKAASLGEAIVKAFSAGKFELAYSLLRNNALAYDGQDFFDTTHQHPTGEIYSNLLTTPRVNPALPDVYEARDEVQLAMAQLMLNSLIRNTVIRSDDIEKSIIVIAKSFPVWLAYNSLRTETEIDGNVNRFKNTFGLWWDRKPAAGGEDSVDFIWADPSGPRPTIFVSTREPDGLKFDETKEFSHHMIPFGMDGEYAAATGFPQTAVRVEPAAA